MYGEHRVAGGQSQGQVVQVARYVVYSSTISVFVSPPQVAQDAPGQCPTIGCRHAYGTFRAKGLHDGQEHSVHAKPRFLVSEKESYTLVIIGLVVHNWC